MQHLTLASRDDAAMAHTDVDIVVVSLLIQTLIINNNSRGSSFPHLIHVWSNQ